MQHKKKRIHDKLTEDQKKQFRLKRKALGKKVSKAGVLGELAKEKKKKKR